jgi:thioredoxin-like negative regulator of GroEL
MLSESRVLAISNDKIESLNTNYTVLYFWASWAEPCAQMSVIFEELSKEHKALTFVSLEAEENMKLAENFQVESVPFFVVVDKTLKAVEKLEGNEKICG